MLHDDLYFRIHAVERMLEHDITEVDVRDVIEHGEVIEETQDHFAMQKLLFLHFVANRPIHVVAVNDDDSRRTEIITAYEPDLNRWQPGFRTRRTS